MGLFGGPENNLKAQLRARRLVFALSSPLGAEAKLNRIVNQIHQSALPVVAKLGKPATIQIIDDARDPDQTDDLTALWRELLDGAAANL